MFLGLLGLLVFMGLYLALFDHLALILPGGYFLGLVCVTGGAQNWKVLPLLLYGNILSLLSIILICLNFMSQKGGKVSPFCSTG